MIYGMMGPIMEEELRSFIQKTFPTDIFEIIKTFIRPSALNVFFAEEDDLQDAMYEECMKGQLENVKYLLSMDAEINIEGNGALKWASGGGNIELVEYLISQKANVKDNRDIALSTASLYGHLDIVKLLLANKADMNADYNTPLVKACSGNQFNVVEYFISLGVDVTHIYNLPIRSALKNNNLRLAQYLMTHGADIRAKSDEAVRTASENGNLEIVRFLVSQGANIAYENNLAVRMALINGHQEVVQYLVSLKADIRAGNDDGLRGALKKGKMETVHYLISQKVDISSLSKCALATIVEQASMNNNFNTVRFLVPRWIKGENITINTSNLDILQYLVAHRADIGRYDGDTLRYASRVGSLSVVKYLIAHGVDPKINIYPLPIIKCLIANGADIDVLKTFRRIPHLPMIRYFVSKGYDVGNYDIFYASLYGYHRIIRYLYNQGVDLRVEDDRVFGIACENNHLMIVKFLISKKIFSQRRFNSVFKKKKNDVLRYLLSRGYRSE